MTKKAYIARALLNGEVLTIMDGFRKFRVTNLPREISRQIEQVFDVEVSRDRVEFTAECGTPGFYYRYRLNCNERNAEGIDKMKAYCAEFFPAAIPPIQQTALF